MQGSLNSVKLSDSQANPMHFMKQEYSMGVKGEGSTTSVLPGGCFSSSVAKDSNRNISYPLKKIPACPWEPLP